MEIIETSRSPWTLPSLLQSQSSFEPKELRGVEPSCMCVFGIKVEARKIGLV